MELELGYRRQVVAPRLGQEHIHLGVSPGKRFAGVQGLGAVGWGGGGGRLCVFVKGGGQ